MDQLDFQVTNEFCESMSQPVFNFLKPRRKRSSAGYLYNIFENQQEEPAKTITPVVGRHLSIDYSNANVGVFDVPSTSSAMEEHRKHLDLIK